MTVGVQGLAPALAGGASVQGTVQASTGAALAIGLQRT